MNDDQDPYNGMAVPPGLYDLSGTDDFDIIEDLLEIDSLEARQAQEEDMSIGKETMESFHIPPARGSLEIPASIHGASGEVPPVAMETEEIQAADRLQTGTDGDQRVDSSHNSASGILPEHHEFDISVNFKASAVINCRTIKNAHGCLLYYQPPDKQVHLPEGKYEKLAITTTASSGSEYPWDAGTQKKYTMRILENLEKGVFIYSRGGNIYAKRRCYTNIFWSSTQQVSGPAIKLQREKETQLFCFESFQSKFREAVQNGRTPDMDLPCIFFSFAQEWDRSSTNPLRTKLVTAVIKPRRPTEELSFLYPATPNPSCISLPSAEILISNETM